MELLRIVLLLALVAVLISTRIKVGYVLFAGALAVPVFFPSDGLVQSLKKFLSETLWTLSPTHKGWEFWRLLIIVLSITVFGNILKELGNITELVEALKRIFGTSRAGLAGLPAIIGLLPMPGGALLSAPMVEKAGEGSPISPEKKTLVNYWFRHIWEYTLPLYPGLIVLSELTELPMRSIVWRNLPLTLAAIVVGVLYALRGVPTDSMKEGIGTSSALKMLSLALLPVIFIVAVNVGVGVNLEAVVPITIISMLIMRILPWEKVTKVFKESVGLELIILVAGVIVFKRMLGAFGVGSSVAPALASLGAPRSVIIFIVPFLIGLLAGYTLAPVSICTPLLIGFLSVGGVVDVTLAMVLYAGAHLGVMLSPAHLCLVLTKEYFKADLRVVYRWMVVPVLCVGGTAFAVLFLIKSILA